jgi:hypothetical protein
VLISISPEYELLFPAGCKNLISCRYRRLNFSHIFLSPSTFPPATKASSPPTKASSSFSITVQTGSKSPSDEEIQSFIGFTCHIVNHINSPVSKLTETEAVNPTANDFIHPPGSQLI